jgi:hypothetical protein
MKLILCRKCGSVRSLSVGHEKIIHCDCRASWGYYTDDINAVIGGEAVPLGFSNRSLSDALRRNKSHTDVNMGEDFRAFIIPEGASSVKREEVGDGKCKDKGQDI